MNNILIEKSIFEILEPKLKNLDIRKSEIDKELSLVAQGIIDSLGFIEFIGKLEEIHDIVFEFDDLEVDDFTSINNLIKLIQDLSENN